MSYFTILCITACVQFQCYIVDILMMKPKLKDLYKLRISDWYGLGLELGLDYHELDVIKKNNPLDFNVQLREMFKMWLDHSEHPSWNEVVQSLEKSKESSLALELSWKLSMYFSQSRLYIFNKGVVKYGFNLDSYVHM